VALSAYRYRITATPEIIVTQAINGAYTARHSDYVDVWSSPSGHGWTREDALTNLVIDAAYIAKHGTVEERIEYEPGTARLFWFVPTHFNLGVIRNLREKTSSPNPPNSSSQVEGSGAVITSSPEGVP
jgi:hypothetical protein